MADGLLLLSPLERVLLLKTLPMMEGLSPGHLTVIAQHARERIFRPGEVIYPVDRPPDALHVVIQGRIVVPGGTSRPEASLGPEALLGFHLLMAGAGGGDGSRAVEETLTLELDWDAQVALCRDHYDVMASYLRFLARDVLTEGRPAGPSPDRGEPVADLQGRVDVVDRCLILRRVPMFAASNVDALWELATHAEALDIGPGEILGRTGDAADHLFVVTSGSLVSRRPGDGGQEVMTPVAVVGLEEILAEEHRGRSLEAGAPACVLRLESRVFMDVLEDHVPLALDIAASLAGRVLAGGADPAPPGGAERTEGDIPTGTPPS